MTTHHHPGQIDTEPDDVPQPIVRLNPAEAILAARDSILDARMDELPRLVFDATAGVPRDALVTYLHNVLWISGTAALLEPDAARDHLRQIAAESKEARRG